MNFKQAQGVSAAALGVGAVLTVVAVATDGLSVLGGLAVLCGITGSGAALLAVRTLRARLAVGERRSRQTEAELESLRSSLPRHLLQADSPTADREDEVLQTRALAALALLRADVARLDPQGPASDELLPAELLVPAVDHLAQEGRLLDADELARRNDLAAELSLRTLRVLARGLRDRGYLARALEYFAAAATHGDPRDARALELRSSEVRVLRGESRPALERVEPVVSVPGRVLHVVGRAVPTTQSGYTLRTHNTARAQLATGIEPHVYVQLGIVKAESDQTDELDGVVYHRPVGDSIFDVGHESWLQANAEALLRVAIDVRPAVLHAHSDFLNLLIARAVGDATGIPVVYEARGFWEESWLSRTIDKYGWPDPEAVFARHGRPEAYTWRREREAEAREAADHVVTLARVMSRRIVAAGLPSDRLTIVPNAVDGHTFEVLTPDEELRSSLGIRPGSVVVGCVTSVVEYEGLELLVDAVARLTSEGLPVWLLVVGDGPVLPGLRERAEALSLTNATFTGKVPHDEVQRYYSVLDVFAVPRRPADVCHLVTPLKPFEAFACGRTVLLSDVEALQEIAEDSGAAELFTAGDAGSLASVLGDLVRDPERRRARAEAGARWVREQRSWTANADAYLSLYASLASRSGQATR